MPVPEPALDLEKARKRNNIIDLPGDYAPITRSEAIRRYGLPEVISGPGGRNHTCGCWDAELTHVSPMQPDGYIYADYRCSVDYSNIFRFKVNQVRLDSRGNIIEQKNPFMAPGAKKAPKLS